MLAQRDDLLLLRLSAQLGEDLALAAGGAAGFIEGIEGEGPGIVDGAGQLRGLLLQLLRKAAMRRLLQQYVVF